LLRPKKKSEKAVKLKLKKDLNSISKSWKSRKKIEKERKEIQERKSKEEITKKEVGSMTKSSRKMKTIRMKQDKARGSMRTGTRYTHTDESSTCLSGIVRRRAKLSHRPLLT